MGFAKLGLILSLVLSTNAQAIVGGHAAGFGNPIASSTVFLYFESTVNGKKVGGVCTGSIISKNTILTASHCTYGATRAVIIFSPQFDLSQKINPNVAIEASKIVTNHLYVDGKFGDGHAKDTAMVRFQGNLPSGYRPIQILEYKKALEYLKVGAEAHLAGYGRTTDNAADKSSVKILREVKTSFVGLNPRAKFELMFAGGACQGDSGGPAYILVSGVPYLIGVTSWGKDGHSCSREVGYSAFFRNQL